MAQDLREKIGQVAHLDQDPSNDAPDNLAYLCLEHHSLYDSSTSQHKNYTVGEVKAARSLLYEAIAEKRRVIPLSANVAATHNALLAQSDQVKHEFPFSAVDLSSRGGLNLDGYKIWQSLRLTKSPNGIDGSVVILIDERLKGLNGGLVTAPYSDLQSLEVSSDPSLWLLETDHVSQSPGPQYRQALLVLVDSNLHSLNHVQLGRESARLDSVSLYPDKSESTFIVTSDYSIGWGSYNGPVSDLLEISGSGGISYILPHGLMNSLKTAWAILSRRQTASEIFSKKCRPNFEEQSPDGRLKFQVIFERFEFDGTLWQSSLIQEDGFWEAVERLDVAEFRTKFRTAG